MRIKYDAILRKKREKDIVNYQTGNLSNPPTQSEINAILGNAINFCPGHTEYLNSKYSNNLGQFVSDGTNWRNFTERRPTNEITINSIADFPVPTNTIQLPITFDGATNEVQHPYGAGVFADGQAMEFIGTLPAPLQNRTIYYAYGNDANSFLLSYTPPSIVVIPVDILANGSGNAQLTGEITLTSGIQYDINEIILTPYKFIFPHGISNSFFLFAKNGIAHPIVYLGVEALFNCSDMGAWISNYFVFSAPFGTLYNISAPSGGQIIYHESCIYDNIGNLGSVNDVQFFSQQAVYQNIGQGLVLENNNAVTLALIFCKLWKNQESTFFTFKGSTQSVVQLTGNQFIPNSNEKALEFTKDNFVSPGVSLVGNTFNKLLGGKVFGNNSYNQRELQVDARGNIGLSDSTISLKIKITDNTLLTTITAANTPAPINTLWSDGSIEERMVFQDIGTFDNITNKITTTFNHGLNAVTITATTIAFNDNSPGLDTITDSGNGFITSGFKAGDQITVTGSVSNDGVCFIESVTAGVITLVRVNEVVTEVAGANITLQKQDIVQFYTISGTLPTGLIAGIDYYVISDTATIFLVSLTRGGSPVDFTDNGSGTNYYRHTTGGINDGWVIYTGKEEEKIAISGGADIEGSVGISTPARIVIIKTDIDGTETIIDRGFLATVKIGQIQSSTVDEITFMKKDEGLKIYIENTQTANDLYVRNLKIIMIKT